MLSFRDLCFVSLAAMASCSLPALAQPPKNEHAADDAAIQKNAEAFVEAFHKGDAKAVAAFWTVDGDYTDQLGKRLSGREAIEKSFAEFFAENKGAKLRIEIDSIKFITAEVAIEDGMTAVITPDGAPPSRAKYTIVHVKKDGKWLIGSVRESVYVAPSNAEHLRMMENVMGSWASEPVNGEVTRITFNWAENQSFITATFANTSKNITIGGGTQWIGWDPAGKTVRSWSFHTNGGFGEGTWTQAGKTWTIKATATLPDGTKATATDLITVLDGDTVSFQAKDRTLDGKPLPDVKEIKLTRVK
jgi:uncharacterized protein (TIGR02246 family)